MNFSVTFGLAVRGIRLYAPKANIGTAQALNSVTPWHQSKSFSQEIAVNSDPKTIRFFFMSSRVFFISLAIFILASCGNSADNSQAPAGAVDHDTAETMALDLATLLAGESRFAGDRERDANRKPANVIAFVGIEPGMNVIDVIAAGGYYTEVLSLAVGNDGYVTAQNPAVVLQMRDGANEKQLSERLANGRLQNVARLNKEIAELTADDGPFDAAMTGLNLHDIYNNYGEAGAVGAMKAIGATLKPGAVFGVIDHHGADGADNKELHRMRIEDAIRVAEAAGFVVEAQSGMLHVHDDDLAGSVFAEGRRGNTHRFVLRLRKPE